VPHPPSCYCWSSFCPRGPPGLSKCVLPASFEERPRSFREFFLSAWGCLSLRSAIYVPPDSSALRQQDMLRFSLFLRPVLTNSVIVEPCRRLFAILSDLFLPLQFNQMFVLRPLPGVAPFAPLARRLAVFFGSFSPSPSVSISGVDSLIPHPSSFGTRPVEIFPFFFPPCNPH